MATFDTDFNTTRPRGTDAADEIDRYIRDDAKAAIDERYSLEHESLEEGVNDPASGGAQGRHKAGRVGVFLIDTEANILLVSDAGIGAAGLATDTGSLWVNTASGWVVQALTARSVAAGAIVPYAMSTPPSGWLECDGSAISRTTYVGLFAAIGTTYGGGDGSNTFNIPALQGEFLRGWDNGAGVDPDAAARTGGDTVGSTQDYQTGNHTHSTGAVLASGYYFSAVGGASGQDSSASESRPRNIAMMYCIAV